MATNPAGGWASDRHLILGKSVVGGSVTGDVFEHVYPRTLDDPTSVAAEPGLTVELGGPWSFYRDFRQAHGLERLPQIEVPEIGVAEGKTLEVPLLIHNTSRSAKSVVLSAVVPPEWVIRKGGSRYSIAPRETEATMIEIELPQVSAAATTSQGMSEVSVRQGVWSRVLTPFFARRSFLRFRQMEPTHESATRRARSQNTGEHVLRIRGPNLAKQMCKRTWRYRYFIRSSNTTPQPSPPRQLLLAPNVAVPYKTLTRPSPQIRPASGAQPLAKWKS